MKCPDCGEEVNSKCSCGWVRPYVPELVTDERAQMEKDVAPQEMTLWCARIMEDSRSRKINKHTYLEELEKLDEEYPGIGFADTIFKLRMRWGIAPF